MRSTSLDGYYLFSTMVEHGGVEQRWIVVFSEKAFTREKKTLEKKIEKEKKSVEKELWHFFNQGFYSAEDGLKALRKMEKAWKYHKVKGIEVVEMRKRKGGGRGRRGRPGNGEDLERFHHIKAGFERRRCNTEENAKEGEIHRGYKRIGQR